MSPISQISVLAFASAVLASPYAGHGHGHAHAHAHRNLHTGSGRPHAYSGANSTGSYGTAGTGTGRASFASATPYGAQTSTNRVTQQTTLYQTVYETVQAAPSASDVSVAAAGASDVCDDDVTVTSTDRVYVTVTAGGASFSSAPVAVPYGSSSSVASPVQSSSSAPSVPAYSAPAYSAPSSSSSEAAPVSTLSSSVSAPAYSAPAYTPSTESSSVAAPVTTSTSIYVAPSSSAPAYTPTTESSSSSNIINILPSTYSVADKGTGYTASASASAAPAYSSTPSTSGGKRGLAYNDASLTDCFSGSSQVSWAYNWISSSGGLTGYNYIPTLHSNTQDFLGSWVADAEAAISSGSTTLFSFNEPDIASQSNLDVATAVKAHKDNMSQFSSKAKVCAPSVSNSGATNQGLSYLQQFLDQCGSDCPVDCLNIHWYAVCDAENFKSHIDQAVAMLTGEQTIYVSEFGVTSGSDDEINSFLQEVMAYMDSNDKVSGYAYFMVEDGKLVSGGEPSTYGSTYMSYTA